MKKLILVVFCFTTLLSNAQTTQDIFNGSEYQYTYLGIDYSHAKFNGDFAQFAEAGEVGIITIKEKYFDGWNGVVVREKSKYNLKDALRKENIVYSTSDVQTINESTVVENMEDPIVEYSQSDIQGFINSSTYSVNEGIGILFFCESLDKMNESATFHFVLVNMETKEVLIHERMTESPGGIGLRNYWISPVYRCIEEISKKKYKSWKKANAVKE